MPKVIVRLLRFLPSFLIIALCMPIFILGSREIGKYLGLIPVPVNVLGTGSMYPSLFWDKTEGGPDDSSKSVIDESRTTPYMYRYYKGYSFLGHTYLAGHLEYGDMVAFENGKTKEILATAQKDQKTGFIKRIIGKPGDRIELRDGYVKKNGELLSEPYINKPRSTYGGTSITECTVITIPDKQYLVMGDNRKVSDDSRGELGLISENDISFYLPFAKQQIYRGLWRDTSNDAKLAGTPTLDRMEFYQLLNQVRQSRKLSSLQANKKLEASSTLSAKEILKGDKTYQMSSAMREVGYSNILTSEFSIKGRFTAQELIENLLYFSDSASRVLDSEMDDIGISDVNMEINGCPTDMIVGHLGGYKPAEYSQDTIKSWQELSSNLKEIIPSWERALEYKGIDQSKIAELLTIYHRRLSLAEEIVKTMENKAWLTDDQQRRIKVDDQDAAKSEQLAREINGE